MVKNCLIGNYQILSKEYIKGDRLFKSSCYTSHGHRFAVNARNLDLQQSSLTADIRSNDDTPSLRARDITVNAKEAITLGQSSQIETTINVNATGNGSNVAPLC